MKGKNKETLEKTSIMIGQALKNTRRLLEVTWQLSLASLNAW